MESAQGRLPAAIALEPFQHSVHWFGLLSVAHGVAATLHPVAAATSAALRYTCRYRPRNSHEHLLRAAVTVTVAY